VQKPTGRWLIVFAGLLVFVAFLAYPPGVEAVKCDNAAYTGAGECTVTPTRYDAPFSGLSFRLQTTKEFFDAITLSKTCDIAASSTNSTVCEGGSAPVGEGTYDAVKFVLKKGAFFSGSAVLGDGSGRTCSASNLSADFPLPPGGIPGITFETEGDFIKVTITKDAAPAFFPIIIAPGKKLTVTTKFNIGDGMKCTCVAGGDCTPAFGDLNMEFSFVLE
jgi:hypothetical protein